MMKNNGINFCVWGILISIVFWGCTQETPQEKLIRAAVMAIKTNDWEAYSKLTITSADLSMKANKVSPFKAKQSFLGGVMKPQEKDFQREQFEKAVKGGEGILNFRSGQYKSLSEKIIQSNFPILSGAEVPCTLYKVVLEIDGKIIDPEALDPSFVVVKWGSFYKIVKLHFSNDNEKNLNSR